MWAVLDTINWLIKKSVSRTCAPGVSYYIVALVSVLVVFTPNINLGGRSKQPVKYATFDESDSSDF